MSSAGWKRRLVVVLVGVVVGFGGLAGQPAGAREDGGNRERRCGGDCYYNERPSGQCGRQAPCRQCDQGRGCGDCYRDRPCGDRQRPAPCRSCGDERSCGQRDDRRPCGGPERPPPCRDCYYDAEPSRDSEGGRSCYYDDDRPCGERERRPPARDCGEKARRDGCDDKKDSDDYDSRSGDRRDDRSDACDRQDRDGKRGDCDRNRDREGPGLERLIRRIFD